MKKELEKNNWDFILYQYGEKKVISVVFHNSFVDVSKSFILENNEENYDFQQLKELAEKIRNNYESFTNRELIPSI
ncbi:hypothetical protein J2X31_003204 [Flavobacterium arsenatis]|uniref:Uncharacterized protein n=1 Tax=Flavobacterium arsenatis TaxID=1484332 RepID=A0ABU1TTK2_9FLAO|nr:hypothetical protein [Flavobacterium arsenatis]MDR6969177.1 hypothetical protein [Flavobacterium arsenatis]